MSQLRVLATKGSAKATGPAKADGFADPNRIWHMFNDFAVESGQDIFAIYDLPRAANAFLCFTNKDQVFIKVIGF